MYKVHIILKHMYIDTVDSYHFMHFEAEFCKMLHYQIKADARGIIFLVFL